MRPFILAALLSSFIFAPVLSGAQEAAVPNAIGLKEAVSAALRDNPEIRSKTWSLKAVEEQTGISRSYLFPSLTYEGRFMRTDNPTYAFMAKLNEGRFKQSDFNINSLNNPEAVNDFQNSIKMRQIIFSKKALEGVRLSKGEVKASRQDFERLKEKVTRDTISAYLGVLTWGEYVKAANQNIADAQEHQRLATLRYNAGMGLYSDVLRADAALKEAQRKLAQAEKGYEVAKRALGLQMGLDKSMGARPVKDNFVLQDVNSYYRSALSRPDLKAIEERYENSRNAIGLAKSSYYPEAGLGGQYQWNDHSNPLGGEGNSYMATAFLRWDLFDGMKREHEVNQAKAKSEEAREGMEGFKKEVMFRVFESYKTVEEAQKNLELANAELKSAEEGTRLVQKRYENSLAPMVDLLDSEMMLEGARTRAAAAGNGLLMSYFNLGFESGRINEFMNIAETKGAER